MKRTAVFCIGIYCSGCQDYTMQRHHLKKGCRFGHFKLLLIVKTMPFWLVKDQSALNLSYHDKMILFWLVMNQSTVL